MLEVAALQHYRIVVNQNKSITPPISTLVIEAKQLFEVKEHESMFRSQLNEISLFSDLAEQLETPIYVGKALPALVQRLRHLQQGLSASYRSEEFFYGKLVDSYKGHPAINIASSTSPIGETLIDFINRAKANRSTWKVSKILANHPQYQQYFGAEYEQDSFYTDRRYQGGFNKGRRGPQNNYQTRNPEAQKGNFNHTRRECMYAKKKVVGQLVIPRKNANGLANEFKIPFIVKI